MQTTTAWKWMMAGVLVLGAAGCESEANETTCDVDTPVSLGVVPHARVVTEGENLRMGATAIYCDKSSTWVSLDADWSSSDETIATVDQSGLVTGLAKGTVAVTGRWGGLENTVRLSVAPALTRVEIAPHNPTIAYGSSMPLRAVGIYSDESKQDLTSSVTWTRSDGGVYAINTGGMMVGTAAGASELKASTGRIISPTVEVEVIDVEVTELEIVGAFASLLPAGESMQLAAQASWGDTGTQRLDSRVSWSVAGWPEDEDAWAEIDASGRLTGLDDGSVVVTATWKQDADAMALSANLTVEIAELDVTGLAITGGAGQLTLPVRRGPQVAGASAWLPVEPLHLGAQASYMGLETPWPDTAQVVNWKVSDGYVARVDAAGTVTALSAGSSLVSATGPSKLEEGVSVRVVDTDLTELEIERTDAAPAVLGAALPLRASAAFTPTESGPVVSQTVTHAATWVSSDRSYVIVDNAGPMTGVARILAQPAQGEAPLTVTVTAYYDERAATIELTLPPRAL